MKPIFITLFLVFASNSLAQNLSTYQLSNNAGIYGLGYNPASIADSRYSYHLNLGAISGSFGQNSLYNSFIPLSKKTYSLSKTEYKSERIDIFGPSLMLQLPKGNSFAISTKYRAGQFAESNSIQNIFENKLQNFTDVRDNYRAISAREIAFSYAHPFAFKSHFFKTGFTYKLLAMSNLTFVNLIKGNLNINSQSGNLTGQIGYQNPENFNEFKLGDLLKNKNSGSGADIGFIYEYRPKHEDYAYQMDGKTEYDNQKTKYQFKFAFSLVDIGQFNSSKFNLNNNIVDLTNFGITESTFDKSIISDLSKFTTKNNTTNNSIETIKLPTRINLFLDTKIGNKGWFLGAFLNSKTKNEILPNDEQRKNILAPAQLMALIPRFEKDGFDFSMPIVYQNEIKKIGLGLQLNLGSLFFGTESINSFFQKNAPNPTFYAGFSISKLGKKIKDSDGDGVSDKQDICPDLKGLWAFKGCPDTDGDGIKDSEDDCPEHAGPAATKGCPDTDKDGIFDKNDACPTLAGPSKFNGCPDTDNDGLPDNEDECPTKAGSAEFGGCPDTDKDGLMDNEDECPDQAGIKLLKGCPDADGDGIADKYDACPNEKGNLNNKGCPDTDGDGLIDKEDDCPTEAGEKTNKGCPDTDNDGLVDKNDECPLVKGEVQYGGCPIQNFTKLNEDLAKEQNNILNKLAIGLIDKNISDSTLDQLKNSVLTSLNSKLQIIVKGSKSRVLKQSIENYLKEKLSAISFEIIEENEMNMKTGLEIRFVN